MKTSSKSGHQDIIMKSWMKKKGSKFGFWHRRFCVLTKSEVIIYKTENSPPERSIELTPTVQTIVFDNERPPRFVLQPEEERPIILADDNLDLVLHWITQIRDVQFMTPNMSINDFEIVSVLGRGFYGKVMLCKDKATEEYYAIKTIHKNRLVKANKVHTIFMERNVLMKARHPFIVNFCFAFQNDQKVYLGLEYEPGGELFHHLQTTGPLPIEEVRLYIAELSLALNFLHNKKIIYRDLKPENILLDANGHVKLTDFGLSKILDVDDETASTFCGTSEYLAPEIISRKPYTNMIDWWAIGILTYELLFGRTPFYDSNKAKLFQSIRCDQPKFPKNADPMAISFIAMLLDKDPDQRAGFESIPQHPFFKGISFEDVLERKIQPKYVPPRADGFGPVNFDREFTMENPQDSLCTPIMGDRSEFNGFSYFGDKSDTESSNGDVQQ